MKSSYSFELTCRLYSIYRIYRRLCSYCISQNDFVARRRPTVMSSIDLRMHASKKPLPRRHVPQSNPAPVFLSLRSRRICWCPARMRFVLRRLLLLPLPRLLLLLLLRRCSQAVPNCVTALSVVSDPLPCAWKVRERERDRWQARHVGRRSGLFIWIYNKSGEDINW